MKKRHPDNCLAHSWIIDTRIRAKSDGTTRIRRIRICQLCDRRFATAEISARLLDRLLDIARANEAFEKAAASIYRRLQPRSTDAKT
jgi:transcriptional regulator NrdR family protein